MVTSNFPNPGYEMFVNNTWTPITSDMYLEGGTTYARGRRSEGSNTDYGSATLHLKNLDGKYSNRNPSSPYFGKIGRNTPFRQSLQVPDHFLSIPFNTNAQYETADTAALDVTGDIDMRIEIAPQFWAGYSATLTNLGWSMATKWAGAGNRSWFLGTTSDGRVQFTWSADGTNSITAQSTEPVRASPGGRIVVRVTLDVNNGASGNTTTFYTSTSTAGPWEQLGAPVVKTGTTSIFSSTVALWVGDDSSIPLSTRIERKIYRFEMRNGINGTVVANPDWSIQNVGLTSFTDSAGRFWIPFSGLGLVSDRVYRFVTEGSEWSPRWGVGGKKVITPVETSGIMRRLDQGTKPVQSALYNRYVNGWVNPADAPRAYWPMEDGKFTTLSKSPNPAVKPLLITNMKMSDNDTCPPSAALPTLTSASQIEAPIPTYTPTGTWQVEAIVRMDSAPSTNSTLFEWTTTSSSPWTIWRMMVASGLMQLVVESGDGATTLVFATPNPPNMFGVGWLKFKIFVIETGADLFVAATWQSLLEQGLGTVNANSATLVGATAGRINNYKTRFGTNLSGASFGHLAIYDGIPTSDGPADNAFNGDRAGTRMMNLSTDQGVPFFGVGSTAQEEPVGYRRAETYLTLMREAEEADGGALCEDRTTAGLIYRDRASMYTQKPALTVPYGHLTTPMDPTDDDQRTRNQTTVQRKDGASSTVSLDVGPMSTQDYPNGVGLYDQSLTLSLADDNRTATAAGWRNHLGTWDEARHPQIRLMLHEHPEYIKDVIGIDTGSIIRVTNLPPWLPPGPLDLMVEGYEEMTKPHWWEITFSCSPAGPWNVAVMGGAGAVPDEYARASSSGSVVSTDMTTTQTTMNVSTTQDTGTIHRDKALWTEAAGHYPMLLRAGGEVVQATGARPLQNDLFLRSVAAGSWGTATDGQTWTFSGGNASERSVNGTQGVVTLAGTNASRYQYLAGQTVRDGDCLIVVSVSATATGAALSGGVLYRRTASLNYKVRVVFNTAGTVSIQAQSGANPSTTVATGFTYSAGTRFNLRTRVSGNFLLGKAWPQTTGEPANWQVVAEQTLGLSDEGEIGCEAFASSGNTNVSPEIRFDLVRHHNPQTFTGLTRSVNGVVKTHNAGDSSETVQVYKPAIAAL